MSARRGPVVGSVALLLLVGGLVDRADAPPAGESALARAALMPTAAPASALSSTWYCAGGTVGELAGSVVVANPTGVDVFGTVTALPVAGVAAASTPFKVGARASASVALADVVNAPYAGAVVQVEAGQVVVEHTVSGPSGTNTAPCASSASAHWYFADGSTAKDATLLLALLNPFPEDAIADLSFTTDQGRAVPSDFQGVVVPARGLVVVNVGDHVRRREWLATDVDVRSGRLVADEVQTRTAPGKAGVSLVLGAPSAGLSWWFPDGYASGPVAERYTFFNPGPREARVELSVALDQGSAEPFELSIPARGRVALESTEQARIPRGVAHAAAVQSLNGVPVVVQRTVETSPGAERSGRVDLIGARRLAPRWALAVGSVTDATDEWVTVYNPGARAAVVSLTGLADGQLLAIEGLQRLSIPAHARRSLRLGDHVKRDVLPVVVTSNRPVAVERALYGVTAPGMSAAIAIPLD